MGIVCGLHLIDDEFIDQFLESPEESENYFLEHYVNPDGKFHNEGENFFYLDKAWDIASFLIVENDTSEEKVLSNLFGQFLKDSDWSYIKTIDVVKKNIVMSQISLQQIDEAYNESKMQDPYVYNAGYFTKTNNWDYILNHVKIIFTAFKKATENGKGIIVYKG
ncbi:DUF1877 family protein [Flavobacterium chilense]|uniref:DUF1877 domain-containing protein n=1 Tax=Flavobacterium chilense TaxID=946677 RepID=A0A1M6Y2Q4_9FLAO|nr:DUF1877 family protein [Flavobacterium chilense]SHL12520.1 protein of unknown function [Flavobacterium chilense]